MATRQRKRVRQSRWYEAGRRIAAGCGLFLLEEGDRDAPKWLVMSTASGRTLATYFPKSGRWFRAGGSDDDKGVESNWRQLFARVRGFDGK